MPSSRGYSWPRDWTQVSCTAGRPFTAEPSGKPNIILLLLRGEKKEIVWVKVTHSCLTLCDPMENSPGRILKWVAYPFSTRSSWPRNWTGVPCIAGGFFTNWAIREDWFLYTCPPLCENICYLRVGAALYVCSYGQSMLKVQYFSVNEWVSITTNI